MLFSNIIIHLQILKSPSLSSILILYPFFEQEARCFEIQWVIVFIIAALACVVFTELALKAHCKHNKTPQSRSQTVDEHVPGMMPSSSEVGLESTKHSLLHSDRDYH